MPVRVLMTLKKLLIKPNKRRIIEGFWDAIICYFPKLRVGVQLPSSGIEHGATKKRYG
jgi:hypothetical protein